MNSLWAITIDDFLEVVKRGQEAGLKPGDSLEQIFKEYMQEKGQTPFGNTELTRDELLNDLSQKHGNVLDITTDSEGKSEYRIIKPPLDNQ